jgi:hypothetical protein
MGMNHKAYQILLGKEMTKNMKDNWSKSNDMGVIYNERKQRR